MFWTEATFHFEISALKRYEQKNIKDMSVTLAVFQLPMSSLKKYWVRVSTKRDAMLDTVAVFQLLIGPYVAQLEG
jgi:hypothetical protein